MLTQSELIELSSNVTLEVDLTSPPNRLEAPNQVATNKLAICLHPWSWLGGRKDDPVLLSLVPALIAKNYHVIRYNSRGVGNSTGWASFTGLSEVEDLRELVKYALELIPGVCSVVFVGYSYGSLITSLHPVVPGIRTSHIFISYPLGPRGWLTLFHTRTYAQRLTELVQDVNANVLILYGCRDEFTGVEGYRSWREGVELGGGDRVKVVEVESASHFWRGNSGERLEHEVALWLP